MKDKCLKKSGVFYSSYAYDSDTVSSALGFIMHCRNDNIDCKKIFTQNKNHANLTVRGAINVNSFYS